MPFWRETTNPSSASLGAIVASSRLRMVRLHGEQADREAVGEILRQDRRRSHRELLDRSLDRQPVPVDRLDVVAVGIAKEHFVAVAHQPGADGAADCSGSDDDVPHFADARTNRVARSTIRECAVAKGCPGRHMGKLRAFVVR